MPSIARILSASLLLMVACEPVPPDADGDPNCAPLEGPVSNLQQTLRATGLYKTDSTNLAPTGALQRADNAALRDDGFLEPLRGFAADVDFGTTVDALYPWTVDGQLWLLARGTNNTLYRRVEHTGATFSASVGDEVVVTLPGHGLSVGDKIAVFESSNTATATLGMKTVTSVSTNDFTYEEDPPVAPSPSGGTITGKFATVAAYTGSYSPPTGYPMRFWEAGRNLFFTTSSGVYRLDSPTATPVLAGAPQGLEGIATVTTPSTGGWLPFGSSVAYRSVWGRRTEDGRLILGAPSGRMLLTNTAQNNLGALVLGKVVTRTGGNSVSVASTGHGLSVGDPVIILVSDNEEDFPLGVKTVATVPDANHFTYLETGANLSATVHYIPNDDGVRNGACTTYIPGGVDENVDFCQLYRTVNTTTGGVDPGEDMGLVAERFPNSTEIAAGSISFEDIAPFANGADAYFSPSAGTGGIGTALNRPPLVTDGLAFRDYAFTVANQSRRAIGMSLLAIGGRQGLDTFNGLELDANGTVEKYLAGLIADEGISGAGGYIFGRYTTYTTAENIEKTAQSLVRVINLRSAYWMAQYASADADPPGRILITERDLLPVATKIRAVSNQRAWSPTLLVEMSGEFTRAGSTVTVSTFPTGSGTHHLEVGDRITIATGSVNFPPGVKTIVTVPDEDHVTYTEAGAAAGPTTLDFANDTPDRELESTLLMNSWMFSAQNEWDGFPEINQRALGGPTNTVSRLLQFGQSVIFFSNEGIWRLTGTDAATFRLDPYANGGEHVRLFAPNTVAKIETGAFGLMEDGVTGVDEGSFNQGIGQPISNVLRPFLTGSDTLKAATKANAFAVGNSAEGEYWLFLPDETATSPLYPSQAYIFSTRANGGRGGWTRYIGNTRTAVYSRTDQRMYLAPTTSGSILRERRDKAPTDFYGPDNTTGVSFGVEYVPYRGTSPTAEKQWVKATLSVENSPAVPMPQSVGMWFSTSNDGHTTWWGNQHTAHGDGIYATYSPLEVCRGGELGVKIEHSTPGEWLRIKDLSLTYNQASELRVGR